LERFEECFDAYRDVIKNTNDDYDDERATNLSAVAANLAIEESVLFHLFPTKEILFYLFTL